MAMNDECCLWVAATPPSQVLEDYFSAALGRKGPASRVTRLASFPPVLVIQLQRYYTAGEQYTAAVVCYASQQY